MRDADAAMYMAKQSGKGALRSFSPRCTLKRSRDSSSRRDLQRAMDANEFTLRYQPIMDLARGDMAGMEALARWEHPIRGTVSPAEFIPLVEEAGLIVPLGRHILREACRQAVLLQRSVLASRRCRFPSTSRHSSCSAPSSSMRFATCCEETGDRAEQPDPRADGERDDARHGPEHLAHERPALARRPAGDRRLRHRLFVAGVPPHAARRHPQDRQVIPGGSERGGNDDDRGGGAAGADLQAQAVVEGIENKTSLARSRTRAATSVRASTSPSHSPARMSWRSLRGSHRWAQRVLEPAMSHVSSRTSLPATSSLSATRTWHSSTSESLSAGSATAAASCRPRPCTFTRRREPANAAPKRRRRRSRRRVHHQARRHLWLRRPGAGRHPAS